MINKSNYSHVDEWIINILSPAARHKMYNIQFLCPPTPVSPMVEKSEFPEVVHNDCSQVNSDVSSIEQMTIWFPFIQFVIQCKTQKAKSYEHNCNIY